METENHEASSSLHSHDREPYSKSDGLAAGEERYDGKQKEGKRKALVIIGHVPSEQMGTEECVRWLKTFVKNVEFVPTKQPFWTVK